MMKKNLEVRDRKTTTKDKMSALDLATSWGLPSAYLEMIFREIVRQGKKTTFHQYSTSLTTKGTSEVPSSLNTPPYIPISYSQSPLKPVLALSVSPHCPLTHSICHLKAFIRPITHRWISDWKYKKITPTLFADKNQKTGFWVKITVNIISEYSFIT